MPILAQISYKPEWQQNFLRITAHSGKGRQGLKKKRYNSKADYVIMKVGDCH